MAGSVESGSSFGGTPREDGTQPDKRLPRQTRSVFVADDDHLIRKLLGRQLEAEGFESGTSLLEQVQAQPNLADAIILDQTMPELSGIEVAILLAERGCRAPIILMSGDPYPIAEQASALGVPILAKPFTFDALH